MKHTTRRTNSSPAVIRYSSADGPYDVGRVEVAANGFTYLRELYDIPGFTREDYELVLEHAEEQLFDMLDGNTILTGSDREKLEEYGVEPVHRPADYGLAEQVDGFCRADHYRSFKPQPTEQVDHDNVITVPGKEA